MAFYSSQTLIIGLMEEFCHVTTVAYAISKEELGLVVLCF